MTTLEVVLATLVVFSILAWKAEILYLTRKYHEQLLEIAKIVKAESLTEIETAKQPRKPRVTNYYQHEKRKHANEWSLDAEE